jgi:hypothetical protein
MVVVTHSPSYDDFSWHEVAPVLGSIGMILFSVMPINQHI